MMKKLNLILFTLLILCISPKIVFGAPIKVGDQITINDNNQGRAFIIARAWSSWANGIVDAYGVSSHKYSTNIDGENIQLFCKDAGLRLDTNSTVKQVTELIKTNPHDAGIIYILDSEYNYDVKTMAIRIFDVAFGKTNIGNLGNLDSFNVDSNVPEKTKEELQKAYQNRNANYAYAIQILKQLTQEDNSIFGSLNISIPDATVCLLISGNECAIFDSVRNFAMFGDSEDNLKTLLKKAFKEASDVNDGKSVDSANSNITFVNKEDGIPILKNNEYVKNDKYNYTLKGFDTSDDSKDSIILKLNCEECKNFDIDDKKGLKVKLIISKNEIELSNSLISYLISSDGLEIFKKDFDRDIQISKYLKEALEDAAKEGKSVPLTIELTFSIDKDNKKYNCGDRIPYTLDIKYTGSSSNAFLIEYDCVGDICQGMYGETDTYTPGEGSDGEDNKEPEYTTLTQEGEIYFCDADCDSLKDICEHDGIIDSTNPDCKDYLKKCKKNCTVKVSGAKCSSDPKETTMQIVEGVVGNSPCNNDGKVDIYECIIDGHDINGNEYNLDNVDSDKFYEDKYSKETNINLTNNKFCKVACVENFKIELPTEQFVTSGRYFSVEAKIAGGKTCYTSIINKGDVKTEDDIIGIWDKEKNADNLEDKINAKTLTSSFEYLFEIEREKMMMAKTIYDLFDHISNENFKDWKKETSEGTNKNHSHSADEANKDCCSHWNTKTSKCEEWHDPIYLPYKYYIITFSYDEYNYILDGYNKIFSKDTQSEYYISRFEGNTIGEGFEKKTFTSDTTTDEDGNTITKESWIVEKDSDGEPVKTKDANYLKGVAEFADISCSNGECTLNIYGTSEWDDDSHKWIEKLPEMTPSEALIKLLAPTFNLNGIRNQRYDFDDLKDLYRRIVSEAKQALKLSVEDINDEIENYYNKMLEYEKQLYQCSHWDMGVYNYNPEIGFSYDDSYINSAQIKKLEPTGNVKPLKENHQNCKKEVDLATKEDLPDPTCNYPTNYEADKKIYICNRGDNCSSDLHIFKIPDTISGYQKSTISDVTYVTPTQYGVQFPTGQVIVPNSLGDSNIDKVNMLENAWPVDWIGSGEIRTYRLYVKDLGEFFNENSSSSGKTKLGRVWDSAQNGENKEKSIVETAANECGISSGANWSIHQGSNEYICSYGINCPDCPSECDPTIGTCELEDDKCYPSCPSYCEGICVFNGDMQVEARPITDNKVNVNERELGPNWSWDANGPTTALELKAFITTKEIESDGEDVFNVFEASEDIQNNVFNTGQMEVHLTREMINYIKEYNNGIGGKDSIPYSDDSLVCYDYKDTNNKVYKGIFCYSTFIDTLVEKYKDNISFSKTRLLNENERKNTSNSSGYWTTWDKVDYNDYIGRIDTDINLEWKENWTNNYSKLNIGPAWK